MSMDNQTSYAYAMEGETGAAPTPESVAKMLEMIESRLSELRIDANGKTPFLASQSLPKWAIDQINASKIAYVVIPPMRVSHG